MLCQNNPKFVVFRLVDLSVFILVLVKKNNGLRIDFQVKRNSRLHES